MSIIKDVTINGAVRGFIPPPPVTEPLLPPREQAVEEQAQNTPQPNLQDLLSRADDQSVRAMLQRYFADELQNVFDNAREEGLAQGMAEGQALIEEKARQLEANSLMVTKEWRESAQALRASQFVGDEQKAAISKLVAELVCKLTLVEVQQSDYSKRLLAQMLVEFEEQTVLSVTLPAIQAEQLKALSKDGELSGLKILSSDKLLPGEIQLALENGQIERNLNEIMDAFFTQLSQGTQC